MEYSLLKETKTCQVCKKSFANGKALGGHMRSHIRNLAAESSAGSSITPPLRPCNNLGANFRPLETVLTRSVHTSEVVGGRTPDLNKEEGEQQITAAAKRKSVIGLEEVKSVDLESALCLLQMKDMWSENWHYPKRTDSLTSTRKEKDTREYIEIDSEEDEEESDDEYVVHEDEDNSEDGDVKYFLTSDEDNDDYIADHGTKERKGKEQSKYTCDICGKVLCSYQALGGHRKSHRNKRLKSSSDKDGPVVRRHYECQICNRVFESGQALGGHKKVHYAFLQPTNLSTSAKCYRISDA